MKSMTIFRNFFFVCIVMALSSLGVTLPAHSKTYVDFYEVITDGEAPFSNCKSGEISNEIKAIEKSLNDQYSGSTFGIVCLPKWYIVDDPSKKTVVLVPYSLGDEIDRFDVRYQMNDLSLKLPTCSEDIQTCIEPDGFERTAYEYSDANVFPNFTQDAYDYDGFLNTLTSSEIDGVIRTQVVKLIQAHLTSEKYDPNWVDGAVGPGTRKVLEQFFDGLKTQYPDAVPRDILFTNLFPQLIQHEGAQTNLSPRTIDIEPVLAQRPESVETSEKTPAETRIEETLTEENSVIVSETAETTKPEKLDSASAEETAETKRLKLEILNLRKELDEQQALFISSQEDYAASKQASESSLLAMQQQPLAKIWDNKVSEQPLRFIGQKPDGKSIDLEILERKFSELFCTLQLNKSLEEQFVEHLTQNRCFVLSFEEYDEDTNSSRAYDEDRNTLTIPVLEKQSDVILSITSGSLDDFDEVDTNSCWVGLKLLDEENRDTGTTIELWMQVVDVDGRIEAKLTDFDTVAEKEIPWRNRKMQLVELTPGGQTTSCMITSTKAFDFISGDREPNDKATTARIDRLGNVVLTNLPLVKKKAPELHVFLDTLVGPEGDENYGFNGAINSTEVRETQKVFFEGFLRGVQTFLSNRKDIEKVTIHQTVLEGNNRALLELQTFTRTNMVGDTHLITDDFISNYISEFNAGVPGEFDNKKRKLSRLLNSNGNSLFISFGSSGLTDDKVCQRKIPRQDYTENSVIFDVVPSFIIDQLNEADELDTIARGFAFKCSNQDRIVPLKPLDTKAIVEVTKIIETKLNGWRY